jgi:hypothetical protein
LPFRDDKGFTVEKKNQKVFLRAAMDKNRPALRNTTRGCSEHIGPGLAQKESCGNRARDLQIIRE